MTNPEEVEKVIEFADPEEVQNGQHSADSDKSLFMGILSYLGILIIIPFLFSKDNPFVNYHIKQGAVLFVIEAVLWAISGMFRFLMPLIGIIQLALFVLVVIGIVNVVQKREKELPFIGKYSKFIEL